MNLDTFINKGKLILFIMAYDQAVEYKKIRFAFERVRRDVLALREQNSILKEQVAYLRSIVEQNSTLAKENKLLANENRSLLENVEAKQVVGNTDSKKVHYSDCPFAKKMREENRIYFPNVSDAVRKGYKRCVCTKE